MYKMQHYATADTQTQANAMLAALQTVFANYKCKAVLQSNNIYCIRVTRKFKSYKKAVKHFNATVQQFCNTAEQHVCTEQHPVGCYVLDAEHNAVY